MLSLGRTVKGRHRGDSFCCRCYFSVYGRVGFVGVRVSTRQTSDGKGSKGKTILSPVTVTGGKGWVVYGTFMTDTLYH